MADAAARCIKKGLESLRAARFLGVLWKSLWRFGAVNRDMAVQPVHNCLQGGLHHEVDRNSNIVGITETLHLGFDSHFNTTPSVSARGDVSIIYYVTTLIY